MKRRFTISLLSGAIFAVIAAAQLSALCYAQTSPAARIRLPERFRVLIALGPSSAQIRLASGQSGAQTPY